MLRNFKIKSSLSEKQIESDVASYLSWISPSGRLPFRLLDIDEQVTGADKKLDLVIPVYMQFKVSHGLKPSGTMVFPFHLSPLQRIRKYRKDHELADNPILYFKLRDQAHNAEDLQHNVLLKLSGIGNAKAFYVAPLLLDKDEYYNLLCGPSVRTLLDPFIYRDISIHNNSWVSYIGMIPFLRAHVSIQPMERVRDSEHYYSFSSTGDDIAFHSPSSISGIHRLSDDLKRIFGEQKWGNVNEFLFYLDDEFEWFNAKENSVDESGLYKLQEFGRLLYKRSNIRQFLFLSNREILNGEKY